ncbi:transcriptional regulator ATRX-like [Cimex lectularius]|uniref:PHD-type domain-containing protein n=1 Tax=Cimex lectularius TaxID=79782 RepID=A0A8I6SND5_CIMLE|nr:transcriptional regulator ATRX-like [Cimex lectularius]
MVKKVTKPVVSKEEEEYRKDNYSDVKKVLKKNILCTSCNGSVKNLITKGKPKCHPFMDTLLCDKCFQFFGDGEFSVDEDGSDKYCRWCGQGGMLYLCSKCTAGFCKKCIKRNLPRSVLKEVDDDDWECFCCNVKPLYELRGYCWAALQYTKQMEKNGEGTSNKRKLKNSKDDDDDDSDVAPTKKIRVSDRTKKNKNLKNKDVSDSEEEKVEESTNSNEKSSEKISRKEKKMFKKVSAKFEAVLNDALTISSKVKTKVLECKKSNDSFKLLKDVKSVDKATHSVVKMLETLETVCSDMKKDFQDYVEMWKRDLEELRQMDTEQEEEQSVKNGLSKDNDFKDDTNNESKEDSKEEEDLKEDDCKEENTETKNDTMSNDEESKNDNPVDSNDMEVDQEENNETSKDENESEHKVTNDSSRTEDNDDSVYQSDKDVSEEELAERQLK